MRDNKDYKVQTGLRIPQSMYDELKAIAERSGASINALALVLIDVGLSVVNLGSEEFLRSMLRSPEHSDGQCTQQDC